MPQKGSLGWDKRERKFLAPSSYRSHGRDGHHRPRGRLLL